MLMLTVFRIIIVRHQAETAQSATERRAIFDAINLMPPKPSARILLGNGPSRTLLLKMMQYVDLTLICPHRLKSLTEAVDVLTETSPQYLAFCHYACKNTKCSMDHPSEPRENPKSRFQWDQSKLANNLVLSEKCTIVEFSGPTSIYRSVRASTPCVANSNGLCEWDIGVESMGLWDGKTMVYLGLVSESFDGFETKSVGKEWGFHSFNNSHTTFSKGATLNDNFGCTVKKDDVKTFHLNLNDCTCVISINGTNYGTAWTNLPRNVNLYPAATLFNGAKLTIRPHTRL